MTRLSALSRKVRSSLWFLPTLLTLAAAVLAAFTLWLDAHYPDPTFFMPNAAFTAGSEGARGVLSTIAGSIITVTGVVFSITIVALQLASTQFTPRVLRSFTEDRANQLVLGVFIGTFTYALLILRSVRSEFDDRQAFVPAISVTCALALCLLSIGFLIYFINHIARSIQAEVILDRVTRDALRVVDEMYPEEAEGGSPDAGNAGASNDLLQLPAAAPVRVTARDGGYVQGVDDGHLLELAELHDFVIRMEVPVGAFVLVGETLASVWPADCDAASLDDVRSRFLIGPERTNDQDVARGLIELMDIGVRALSPGINDPTTALVAIDRITQVLAVLGARPFPDVQRRGADGALRFIVKQQTFAYVSVRTLSQLRHYGARDPVIAIRLIESIARLVALVRPERRAVLLQELDEVVSMVEREIASPADRGRVLEAADAAIARAV